MCARVETQKPTMIYDKLQRNNIQCFDIGSKDNRVMYCNIKGIIVHGVLSVQEQKHWAGDLEGIAVEQ